MTKIKFFQDNGKLTGFEISGHSTDSYTDFSGKLFCSAISSAVYLAANTLLEIVKADANTVVRDGYFLFELKSDFDASQTVLRGLELHLKELAKQNRKQISFISEV